MFNAVSAFKISVETSRQNGVVYNFLTSAASAQFPFEDLLRAQIVYSISAFDKLMHDLIRIGMVMQFEGTRPITPKFKNEPMSMELYLSMKTVSFPYTPSMLYTDAVFKKLKLLSFQDPGKIADGLSLIWDESSKWDKIAIQMNIGKADFVQTKLKLFATRRNAIVHEADMNPISHEKNPITKQEADDCSEFMYLCGNAIADLVS